MISDHASVFAAVTALTRDSDIITIDAAAGAVDIDEPGVGLDDIAALVAALTGDDSFAPAWMTGDARLRTLRLRRRGTGGVDLIATIEYAGAGWTIVDGFTVTGASLEISRVRGVTTAVVRGDAEIADEIELDVEVALPAVVVTAHLSTSTPGAATQFLAANGLSPSGSRAPTTSPTLVDLSVYGAPTVGQFVIHVEALDLFDAAPFRLRRIVADLWAGARNELSLQAALTIPFRAPHGELELDLSGGIRDGGWSLAGTIALDGFTLAETAVEIAHLFEPGAPAPVLPRALGEAQLRSISMSLDTSTRDASISCVVGLEHGARASVSFAHTNGELQLDGTLTVGDLDFELMFESGGGTSILVGSFTSAGGVSMTLADLVEQIAGPAAPDIGDLKITLHDVALAYEHGTPSKVLLATDLNFGVDLSGLGSLPLIGPMLPKANAMRLAFRAIASSEWSSTTDVPRSIVAFSQLPESLDGPIDVEVQLDLGTGPIALGPGSSTDDAAGTASPQPPSTDSVTPIADSDPSGLTWHDVGKSFGPLHVARLGVLVQSSEVELAITGSIAIEGLTLELTGLSLRYGITDHQLHVALRGFGLELKRDPLHIAGAFVSHGNGFGGRVMIRTPEFGLSALGEFSTIDGHPSAFLYGVLDAAIGGPAFFFVEGLAAGFGYNRRIIPPSVDAVATYPLVQDAVGAATSTPALADPSEALDRMDQHVAPALGDYFLAVGVKFNSFKLLDSFALLVVTIGEHTEIDLIGTSTYQNPPGPLNGVPPLARVELDLVARILPADGLIDVRARLNPRSYVFDPHCHLAGGFAFLAWFSGQRSGDFVLSVGGYHPHFDASKYPAVPRITMTYQVTAHVLVRGQAYFALTPGMFMAGASLDVAASYGSAHATFHMSIDVLIGWEPYHYEASMRISADARWKFIHVSVGAGLDIWGPDFAGMAHIKIGPFSFDLAFGSQSRGGPVPITWQRFDEAFLPAPEKVMSIVVQTGLLATVSVDGSTWSIVDPHALRLATSSIIPEHHSTQLGVAPMGRASMVTTTSIAVFESDGTTPVPDPFAPEHEPVVKRFPSALWGQTVARPANASTVEAVGGYLLKPLEHEDTRVDHRHERTFSPAVESSSDKTSTIWSYVPGGSAPRTNDQLKPDDHPSLPWTLINRRRFQLTSREVS